jgi:hypothetical protein
MKIFLNRWFALEMMRQGSCLPPYGFYQISLLYTVYFIYILNSINIFHHDFILECGYCSVTYLFLTKYLLLSIKKIVNSSHRNHGYNPHSKVAG